MPEEAEGNTWNHDWHLRRLHLQLYYNSHHRPWEREREKESFKKNKSIQAYIQIHRRQKNSRATPGLIVRT